MVTGDSRPVIVVADDDAGTRFLMSSALVGEGFTVVEANDGRQAMEAIASSDPEAVLLDVEMPGINGYAACEMVRGDRATKDLPVVMVTGRDDPESVDRAFDAGATDFISKPINWSLLGHRLRYILRGARNLQALGLSEAENRALLAAIPDRIFVIDATGKIHNNLSDRRIEALPVASNVRALLPAELHQQFEDCVEALGRRGSSQPLEYAAVEHGDTSWYECRLAPHGEDRLLMIIRDISERKRAEQRINFLAFYDSLTGLPNRALFADRFATLCERTEGKRDSIAVLYIDLNRFKRINDSLGSSTGDQALKVTADRLSDCLRQTGPALEDDAENGTWDLARIGGDSFAALLRDRSGILDIPLMSKRLQESIARPLSIGGHEFVVTASIGVSAYPSHGADIDALLKNANMAAENAQRSGRGVYTMYRKSMNAGAVDTLDLENDLRRAIENNELEMYYQPKYHAGDLRVCGAESLLRWSHPERGDIAPNTIMPIAEESGLITEIGTWAINNVCQQIAAWQYFGIATVPVAINVSANEFGDGDIVSTIDTALREAGIEASALELEITENVLISDIRSVMESLHRLRDMGLSLAVDDFGTGYSSLRYLQRFPADVLKIDRSFVHDLERSADSRAICTAIIALARSLGLSVVGEGVENDWQLEFLRRENCEIVQGYLFNKPVNADEFAELMKRGRYRPGDSVVPIKGV